ncbi:MAG TPA: ion channel [Stenotrophomonas sp.]
MTTSPQLLIQRHRYAVLFGALLATVTIGPLLEALAFGHRVMEGLLFASLITAVFPIGHSLQRYVLLGLVLLVQALRWLAHDAGSMIVPVVGAVLWCVLGALAAYHAVRYSLSSARVHTEQLYAALSAYLLIGICGGVIFATLSAWQPASMLVGGQAARSGLGMGAAIYFSFVTLATLGYGDITPASSVMRGLAVLEAIAGQLYLALLVARLVGLRSANHSG